MRVYTPDDKAVQTPNSDTPYSFLGADLRAEPLVLTLPMIEKERYYSLQFIDMYAFNFAYVGSRTTGNDGGSYLLAGPNWKGETPPGIKSVIRAETEFAFVLYRTQLFNPGDLDNVKKIQAGYQVVPLSQFLGNPAPEAPAAVDFIKPLSPEMERTSPEFFNILNFVLGGKSRSIFQFSFLFFPSQSRFEMSRDDAIVAWHEVPGRAPPQKIRPVGDGVILVG